MGLFSKVKSVFSKAKKTVKSVAKKVVSGAKKVVKSAISRSPVTKAVKAVSRAVSKPKKSSSSSRTEVPNRSVAKPAVQKLEPAPTPTKLVADDKPRQSIFADRDADEPAGRKLGSGEIAKIKKEEQQGKISAAEANAIFERDQRGELLNKDTRPGVTASGGFSNIGFINNVFNKAGDVVLNAMVDLGIIQEGGRADQILQAELPDWVPTPGELAQGAFFAPLMATGTAAQIGGTGVSVADDAASIAARHPGIGSFTTNPATLKQTATMLLTKGLKGATVTFIIGIFGSYPFSAWAKQEVLSGLKINARDAREAGDLDLARRMIQMRKDIAQVNWADIIPYANVLDKFREFFAADKLAFESEERLMAKEEGKIEFEAQDLGEKIAQRDVEQQEQFEENTKTIQEGRDLEEQRRQDRDQDFEDREDERNQERDDREAELDAKFAKIREDKTQADLDADIADLEKSLFEDKRFGLIREGKFEEATQLLIDKLKELRGGTEEVTPTPQPQAEVDTEVPQETEGSGGKKLSLRERVDAIQAKGRGLNARVKKAREGGLSRNQQRELAIELVEKGFFDEARAVVRPRGRGAKGRRSSKKNQEFIEDLIRKQS